jgi:hypothetical protein
VHVPYATEPAALFDAAVVALRALVP